MLKAGQPIHHERQMIIWKFQMQATSKQTRDYFKQNDNIMGMISRGVRKVVAFLEETIESYGLTEEWNSANARSNLA